MKLLFSTILALTNSYACTGAEFLAIVVEYSSGTIDAMNHSDFTSSFNLASNSSQGFPTSLSYNGSSWSKGVNTPIFFYTSTANKTYGNPIVNFTSVARSSGAESAMFFSLPSGSVSTYKVSGVSPSR